MSKMLLYPGVWPASSTKPRAFTFIELLVVMTILAIAALVVVPQIAKTDTFEVQGAARTVISDLLHAQNDAIGKQATRRVVFDTTNNTYRLTDASNVTLPAQWLGGSYQVDLGKTFPQVSIDSVSFTNKTVSFDELGSPSEGGSVDLTAGGKRYRITVTAFTGRVTVDEVTGG